MSEDRANILAAVRKSLSTNFGNDLIFEEVSHEVTSFKANRQVFSFFIGTN